MASSVPVPTKFRDFTALPWIASEDSLKRVTCGVYTLLVVVATLTVAFSLAEPPTTLEVVQDPRPHEAACGPTVMPALGSALSEIGLFRSPSLSSKRPLALLTAH